MIARDATPTRTVRLRIRRRDAPDTEPRWEEFAIPVEPGANMISCLQWIASNPRTSDGGPTTPVAYDAACLEEVCGSCTMLINGHVRQACTCLMDQVAPGDGDLVTLEPMSKFPTVRDLMVDRERMFHRLKQLKAWVPIDGTYDLGPGPTDTPEGQSVRYKLSTCMSCGCCLEACPQYQLEPEPDKWDHAFVGAAAISQARLFNSHGTGKVLKGHRLDILMDRGGVSDCGNAQNCVEVCPKDIPLTESIADIGRQATVHGFKKFFSG